MQFNADHFFVSMHKRPAQQSQFEDSPRLKIKKSTKEVTSPSQMQSQVQSKTHSQENSRLSSNLRIRSLQKWDHTHLLRGSPKRAGLITKYKSKNSWFYNRPAERLNISLARSFQGSHTRPSTFS